VADGPSRSVPADRAPLVIGAGLVVLMAAVVVGLLGTDPDHPDARPAAPEPTSTTTTAPGPPLETGLIPISDDDRDQVDLALFGGGDPRRSDDDEAVLVTLSGTELARGPLSGWYTNAPEAGVDYNHRPGAISLTAAPGIDDPVPGCASVHGTGGILAAVCGPEPETDEIRVFTADRRQRLAIGPEGDFGHWRFALPSPNGKWVLAQWSGQCEVTRAYLINARTGRRHAVVPGGVASNAIGWAPDGRAIVGLPAAACGTSGDDPGTYLVDPGTRASRRIHPHSQGARFTGHQSGVGNRLEAVMVRAVEELALEICCNQPSHGGGDAEAGFVFEGHDVGVHAVPVEELPSTSEPRPGTVFFDCGSARYFLYDYGPPNALADPAPDRRFLERAAKKLIPGLYCAPGRMEFAAP
jgi:hypothetical protein